MKYMGLDSKIEEADIVILGIPYDGTTSYKPGTRFAPNEVRINSLIGYETYSPRLNKDLEELKIHDIGDLELSLADVKIVQDEIEQKVDDILKRDVKTCVIGGEHSITYPIIKSFQKKYKDIKVIQFDAHTDLREEFSGSKYSHASVMRRVSEKVGKNNLYQLGIRSGLKEEFEYANKNTNLYKYNLSDIKKVVEELKDENVYISIDLDVLDPAFFPGTGTPEPDGVSSKELFEAIEELSKLNNIIGFDVVELSPDIDSSKISTAMTIKVMREMLLSL